MEPVTGVRTFVLVANRTPPDPEVPLDDLPGKGGRFDLVARFVNASLLTSHGIREPARAIVLFASEPEPTALRIRGDEATGIGPDERSTAARLRQALEPVAMPVWQPAVDGIQTRQVGLDTLLQEVPPSLVCLHQEGEPLGERTPQAGTFVIGDHEGLTPEQREIVEGRADRLVSLGPTPLQADHVAVVVHHELDRNV